MVKLDLRKPSTLVCRGGTTMGFLKLAGSSRRRRPVSARRAVLLAIALAGSLAAGYVFVGVGGWGATTATIEAASLPESASLSGTVDSTTPIKAAQVFIRNVDKRILYMVYTNAGQFRAVALFPGNYEIRATAKGVESEVQKLVVKAGDNPKLKLSLRQPAGSSDRTIVNALESEGET